MVDSECQYDERGVQKVREKAEERKRESLER